MPLPILTTKLFIPQPRPDHVPRKRLIEQLNTGLSRKLTLISAPAGFGKSTLLSSWVAQININVAWLSLDENDNDLSRFLTYFIAALQTIDSSIGEGFLVTLQSPGPPNYELILTTLLNVIAEYPNEFVLVLDDYHVIESKSIKQTLIFLLDYLPANFHLVIATRVDPALSMARLRAREQMTELRTADLRFTRKEATSFLNQVMDLRLSVEDIASLRTRTEGWIAGLQMAVLSMRGVDDISKFVNDFTGDHRHIVDYLVDEVLVQTSPEIKDFLLQTAILERMSAPLCDALTGESNSQITLEKLEQDNLFTFPLDQKREWYRYHHLFADLLKQRLHQEKPELIKELHRRACAWFEKNDLAVEALKHAAAAQDFECAIHLVEGDGLPLYYRGELSPVLNWLKSLPKSLLDSNPVLWVIYAEVLMMAGEVASVEEKIQAAETAVPESILQDSETDVQTRDILGRISYIRATLLIRQRNVQQVIGLARRALELIHPDNLIARAITTWTLGYGYQLSGDREAASRAYEEALEISKSTKNTIVSILAATGFGNMRAAMNHLHQAAQAFIYAKELSGEPPLLMASEAYLGLARIFYEWDDLDTAQFHGELCVKLAQQTEASDISISGQLLLACVKLAQEDYAGAAALIEQANQTALRGNYTYRIPQVAAIEVLLLIQNGDLVAASHLTQKYELHLSQAQVHLAQGDTATALAVLNTYREQMETRDWQDEILKVMVLQAVALYRHSKNDTAIEMIREALTLAEAGGFIRTFIDHGKPMEQLLKDAAGRGIAPIYINKLLESFGTQNQPGLTISPTNVEVPFITTGEESSLMEPLTDRELEVLCLMAEGLTYNEIASQIMVSLNTVRTHIKNIYSKLYVHRRSQAIAKAKELNIL